MLIHTKEKTEVMQNTVTKAAVMLQMSLPHGHQPRKAGAMEKAAITPTMRSEIARDTMNTLALSVIVFVFRMTCIQIILARMVKMEWKVMKTVRRPITVEHGWYCSSPVNTGTCIVLVDNNVDVVTPTSVYPVVKSIMSI